MADASSGVAASICQSNVPQSGCGIPFSKCGLSTPLTSVIWPPSLLAHAVQIAITAGRYSRDEGRTTEKAAERVPQAQIWIRGRLSVCPAPSPSPRPSPLGRGRIVCHLWTDRNAVIGGRPSVNHQAFECRSLSPRERVRVRGNARSEGLTRLKTGLRPSSVRIPSMRMGP